MTDFGISGRALTRGVTTEGGRGTPSYRAPELLKGTRRYTDKVDLWALGCIVYENMTGEKAFPGDFAVASYTGHGLPQLHLPWSSQPWENIVRHTIKVLLDSDPLQRPTAAEVVDLFTFYMSLLVPPLAMTVFHCTAGLSYDEWNSLRIRCSNKIEWLFEFAECHKRKGEKSVANALFDEMVVHYLDNVQQFSGTDRATDTFARPTRGFVRDRDIAITISLFEKILGYIPEWSLAWVCCQMASYLTSGDNDNWERAISVCKQALEVDQGNAILPILLSNLYAGCQRYFDAILTEDQFLYHCPQINIPRLESSLFAFYARVLLSDEACVGDMARLLHS